MLARLLWRSCTLAACVMALLTPGSGAAAGLASEDRAFPAPAVDALDVHAAFAPNGFAAVAWIEQISANESTVAVSLRPPGQDWSPPSHLSTKANEGDPPTGRTLRNVQIAVNARGDAAVAWGESSAGTQAVGVSSRAAGGTFRKPELLDPAMTPLVGIDANGEVTFFDGQDTASTDRVFVRTAPAGASIAGATPDPLSTACGPYDADLAVSPSGDAIVGFKCNDDVMFSLRRNGTWTSSTPFSDSHVSCPTIGTSITFFSVDVTLDGLGHAAGAVVRDASTSNCSMFPNITRSDKILLALPAGGAMAAGPEVAASGTSSSTISPVPNSVSLPKVGIGGDSLVVEWIGGNAAGTMARPVTRTYGDNGSGAPGPPEPIGEFSGFAGDGEVGVGAAGQALVTWISPADDVMLAFASSRPPNGAFGQPVPVSSGTSDASASSAALGETGDGVIAWLQGPTPGRAAHTRGFDATPPSFTGVSMPATARTGRPAAFGAQAIDVWGPVSFAWDFGDGSATGSNPSHSFSVTGTRGVTVTATDSAGNSVSQNGSVKVSRGSPQLRKVTQTHRVFRVGRRPTKTKAARRRVPIGTRFGYTLDGRASVTITIARMRPGRRAGKRFVRRGALHRRGKKGANRVSFSGRIGRRALKPGRYRASFVATAGGGSSRAISLRFRVVR